MAPGPDRFHGREEKTHHCAARRVHSCGSASHPRPPKSTDIARWYLKLILLLVITHRADGATAAGRGNTRSPGRCLTLAAARAYSSVFPGRLWKHIWIEMSADGGRRAELRTVANVFAGDIPMRRSSLSLSTSSPALTCRSTG